MQARGSRWGAVVFGHSPGGAVSAILPMRCAALGGREDGPCSWCFGYSGGVWGRRVSCAAEGPCSSLLCPLVCSFCVTIPVSGKLSGKEAPPTHIPDTSNRWALQRFCTVNWLISRVGALLYTFNRHLLTYHLLICFQYSRVYTIRKVSSPF